MVRRTCTSFAVLAEADAIITHGHTGYRRPRSICALHIGSQESPVRHARLRFVAPETDAKRPSRKEETKGLRTIRTAIPLPFPSALNVRACLSPLRIREYPLKLHYFQILRAFSRSLSRSASKSSRVRLPKKEARLLDCVLELRFNGWRGPPAAAWQRTR